MRTPHQPVLRFHAGAALLVVALGAGAVGALASVGGSGGSADIKLSGAGAAGVGDTTTAGAPSAVAASGRFTITGHVSSLYPGASRALALTIFNPESYGIIVTSITTKVGSPSAACPGTLASVTTFAGSKTVPAHASRHVTVEASLAQAAPNACQGAFFPFLYSGAGYRP